VIGVCTEVFATLQAAMDTGLFAMEMDVGRLAVALALDSDREKYECDKLQSKWNVGSFDRDGRLRSTIEILFPDRDDPYRKIEELLQTGLKIMSEYQTGSGRLDLLGIVQKYV